MICVLQNTAYWMVFLFLMVQTVKTLGSTNWLTFANIKTVERLDVDTGITEIIATNITNAVDLDIHYNKGLVYWTDVYEKKIMRTSVTKDSFSGISEVIVAETVDVPDGIAIDWIYDLLYWTDTGHNHIQVARLDGTQRKTIIKDEGLDQPRAIVVDPKTGWLFFSDWGTNPRIERCRMDGDDRTTIIKDDIVWPNGMSIDHVGRRLYWIDGNLNQIKSTKFDGTDTRTILKNEERLPKPFDLVVFNSYIYWSNWIYRSISRINKYTGQDLKQVKYVRSPMGIQMFGPGSQINVINLCGTKNGGCSHICFPLPAYNASQSTELKCSCPDFYKIKEDQKMCAPIEPPTELTINATSDDTSIAWELPKTSDFIIATNVALYDVNKNAIYTSLVYYPTTTLSISMQLDTCHRYTVKLKCRYSKAGWSLITEEDFWITDNVVLTDEGNSVNVSWTTSKYSAEYNVWFHQSEQHEDILIYSDGILHHWSGKYSDFTKQGRQIQMTINGFNKYDVGLYKSTPKFNSSIVDGCALVLLKDSEKPDDSNYRSKKDRLWADIIKNIIKYAAIGGGSFVVVLIVAISVCCYRKRTCSQKRKVQHSSHRDASENRSSGLYQTIDDEIELTTNMERSNAKSCEHPFNSSRYQTLSNSRTDSNVVYEDINR